MADSISTTFARQDKGKEPHHEHHENLPSCVHGAWFCSLGAFKCHRGCLMVLKMKTYTIADLLALLERDFAKDLSQ